MAKSLGELLRTHRERRKLSLRDVEAETGIANAHLAQIESGTIKRPAPALLWTLSGFYDIEFDRLMQLANHSASRKTAGVGRRSLSGAALHTVQALGELSPEEERDLVRFMEDLRRRRSAPDPG